MKHELRKDEAFGVIPYRKTQEGVEVLMVKQRKGQWSFPKGHLEPGEDSKAAAIRECEEETGLAVTLEDKTIAETYTFEYEGERVEKTSTYWFGHVEEGTLRWDGDEILSVEWIPLARAEALMTFPSRKLLITRVREEFKDS